MILKYKNKSPEIDSSCFVAENATIVGEVKIKEDSSVWFGAVIRADNAKVEIGKCSNIQDNAVVHVDMKKPVIIGDNVTVGHAAIIHGCEIGDNTLIGMGAIVMNGAKVGKNCIIGAGALVTEDTVIPDNTVAFGQPAKPQKEIGVQAKCMNKLTAVAYKTEAKEYKK